MSRSQVPAARAAAITATSAREAAPRAGAGRGDAGSVDARADDEREGAERGVDRLAALHTGRDAEGVREGELAHRGPESAGGDEDIGVDVVVSPDQAPVTEPCCERVGCRDVVLVPVRNLRVDEVLDERERLGCRRATAGLGLRRHPATVAPAAPPVKGN